MTKSERIDYRREAAAILLYLLCSGNPAYAVAEEKPPLKDLLLKTPLVDASKPNARIDTLIARGKVLKKAKYYKEAIETFEQALEIVRPRIEQNKLRFKNIALNLYHLYFRLHEWTEAEKLLEIDCRPYWDQKYIDFKIAHLYGDRGKNAEARAIVDKYSRAIKERVENHKNSSGALCPSQQVLKLQPDYNFLVKLENSTADLTSEQLKDIEKSRLEKVASWKKSTDIE